MGPHGQDVDALGARDAVRIDRQRTGGDLPPGSSLRTGEFGRAAARVAGSLMDEANEVVTIDVPCVHRFAHRSRGTGMGRYPGGARSPRTVTRGHQVWLARAGDPVPVIASTRPIPPGTPAVKR